MATNVTINGSEYPIDDLTDAARAQVTNIQVTEREIARLQQQIAMMQTAKSAYTQALQAELPEEKK